MEPSKMDNQFRKQLNEREIQPSEAAWDRLDAMLSIAEKKKRKFPWMYIAASVLGFLLIGTVFFSSKGDSIEIQKEDVVFEKERPIEPERDAKSIVSKEAVVSESLVTTVVSKTEPKRSEIKVLTEESTTIKNNQVAEVLIINQKTEKQSIKSQSNSAAVDQLLAAVENSSKKETQFDRNPSIQVDAAKLLSQVDGELELSFREKVINRVSKNYHTVKVALAKRNLE